MLSKKTIIFLAALLALLVAANRFADRLLADRGRGGPAHVSLLAPGAAAAVSALAVSNGAASVAAERAADGSGWRLGGDPAVRADEAAVGLLVETVARARVLDRVTARQRAARGLSPADYGFAPPRAAVRFGRGGAAPTLVEFGADTPGGDGVFARIDGGADFFVVERAALDALPAAPDDLRDRVVFVPNGRTPVSLAIRDRTRGEIRLSAGPGGLWRIEAPYLCAAAPDAVEPLLRSLSASVAERFVPAREAVDAGLSPDETPLALSLRLAGEPRDRDFFFGKPDPAAPALVYVSPPGGPCCTVVRTVLDALRMDLDVLREHRILPYGREDLRSLSFESAAGVFELAREGGPGSPWRIRRPTPQPADPAATDAFLDALLSLRDVGAEPAPAAAPPAAAAVRLSLEPFAPFPAAVRELTVEPAADGASTNLVVASADRSLRQFVDAAAVPAGAFDPAALAALRSRTVIALPEGALPGSPPALAALLADFRARAVAALFVPDSAPYGLLPPRAECTVRTALPERPVVIFQLGAALPDGGCYLRVKGADEIFEIGPEEAATLAAAAAGPAATPESRP